MAFIFGTAGQGALSSSNPVKFSFPGKSGAKLFVLGIAGALTSTRGGGAPTISGTVMSQIANTQIGTGENICEMWYIANNSDLAATVSIPNTGALSLRPIASSYISSFTPTLEGSAVMQGTTVNPILTITTTHFGNVLVDMLAHGRLSGPTSWNGTIIGSNDEGAWINAAQYFLPASAGILTASYGVASDDVAYILASFFENNVDVTITQSKITASAVIISPTTRGNATLALSKVLASLIVNSPTVTCHAIITASKIIESLIIKSFTMRGDAQVLITKIISSAIIKDPNIVAVGIINITVSASVSSISLIIKSPAVTGSAQVAASSAISKIQIFTPIIKGNAMVSSSPVFSKIQIFTPIAIGGASVSSSKISANIIIKSPTVMGDAITTVSSLLAKIQMLAPTIVTANVESIIISALKIISMISAFDISIYSQMNEGDKTYKLRLNVKSQVAQDFALSSSAQKTLTKKPRITRYSVPPSPIHITITKKSQLSKIGVL